MNFVQSAKMNHKKSVWWKKAKSEKNYALADEIREKIKDKWWLVKDNKEWYELQKI